MGDLSRVTRFGKPALTLAQEARLIDLDQIFELTILAREKFAKSGRTHVRTRTRRTDFLSNEIACV